MRKILKIRYCFEIRLFLDIIMIYYGIVEFACFFFFFQLLSFFIDLCLGIHILMKKRRDAEPLLLFMNVFFLNIFYLNFCKKQLSMYSGCTIMKNSLDIEYPKLKFNLYWFTSNSIILLFFRSSDAPPSI